MLRIILGFAIILLSCTVFAQSKGRPESFETKTGKAVFPDFLTADYDIEYDLAAGTTKVVANIKFKLEENGLPIFDSITTPVTIEVNGKKTTQELTHTPDDITQLRVIQEELPAGIHTMKIEVPMDQEYLYPTLKMDTDKVENLFHMSDGEDRNFLELFLPASFEYDQVKMNLNVSFKNTNVKHEIYANGEVTKSSDGNFSISFPEHFTTSSLYFHAVPEDEIKELKFEMKSVDGRKIPAVVYYLKSNDEATENMLKRVVEISTQTLEDLEANFGAYPHDVFIVFNEGGANEEPGSGPGMEYCGAMIIHGISPLRHEIIHSYFGRGVMPANGNAGWLDEALTVWAENGYKSSSSIGDINSIKGMASLSQYHRHHHEAGYHQGAEFIAYVHGKLKSKGGLMPFLRDLMTKKKLKTITTEEFQKDLSDFYKQNFDDDFNKFVYKREKDNT